MHSVKTFELIWCNFKAKSPGSPSVSDVTVDRVRYWIHSSHTNKRAEVILCEVVCEINFTQLLLVLSLPDAEKTNSSVVG
jgi:hypothetical protein